MGAMLAPIAAEAIKWLALIGVGFGIFWVIKRTGKKEAIATINVERLQSIQEKKDAAGKITNAGISRADRLARMREQRGKLL